MVVNNKFQPKKIKGRGKMVGLYPHPSLSHEACLPVGRERENEYFSITFQGIDPKRGVSVSPLPFSPHNEQEGKGHQRVD
jgi:hypothetical protein